MAATTYRITIDDKGAGAIIQALSLGLLEGECAERRIDLYQTLRARLVAQAAETKASTTQPPSVVLDIETDTLKAWGAGCVGGWMRRSPHPLNDAEKDVLLRSARALQVEGYVRGMLPAWKAPDTVLELDGAPFAIDPASPA